MPSRPSAPAPHIQRPNTGADEDAIASWFRRAGECARAMAEGHLTCDEAKHQLAGEVGGVADVVTLQRAAWDAETVLGPEASISVLLRLAVVEVTQSRPAARTSPP